MNKNIALSLFLIAVVAGIGFYFVRHGTAPDEPTVALGKCYVGGCSREVCSDQPDVASNCIYKPEFACYEKSTCERQADGQCGWTDNLEFSMCINAVEHPGADLK